MALVTRLAPLSDHPPRRPDTVARITLLTDFGTRDGYVGAMKGVIASVFPGVIVDDVSHAVGFGDVDGAGRALARYWNRYPPGTTHLVVVDPGVGTERRALAVEADRRLIVVPDNGAVSRVLDIAKEVEVVGIENPGFILPETSSTFHGRDIFAPAAAYLARGVHLSRLGPPVSDPVRLREPLAVEEDEAIVGEVVSLDRFGNLVTNLPGKRVGEGSGVEIEGRTIPVVQTYADVPPNSLAAVVNSDGCLEVAARDRSAAKLLKVEVGTRVRIPLLGRSS